MKLFGDNGILKISKQSVNTYNRESIIEQIKSSIKAKEVEKGGRNITESELNEILEKYGTISGEGENKILTTEQNDIIKVTDI